jgi:2-polyprenyl-3-methyl-5-hydroxy-6-metoxy-1,4-benzoquinol methylase
MTTSRSAEGCKICGTATYHREYDFSDWRFNDRSTQNAVIVRCLGCGIRRTEPKPTPSYGVVYDNDYASQGLKFLPFYLQHIGILFSLKYQDVAIRGFPGGARALDYGCSTGVFLKLVSSMGFAPTGFDISAQAVEHCTKMGLHAYSGDFFAHPFELGSFDVIHCSHVIEHVEDPIALLTRFRELLKPNGHLLLSCPNYASLARWSKGVEWRGWDPDCHLWHFTLNQICRLAKDTGFRIVHKTTVDGNVPDSRLKKKALNVLAKLGFGDSIMIAAVPSAAPENR